MNWQRYSERLEGQHRKRLAFSQQHFGLAQSGRAASVREDIQKDRKLTGLDVKSGYEA
jgi:hypothetical protein